MSQQQEGISRRHFLTTTSLGGLALAAGGVTLPFGFSRIAAAVNTSVTPPDDKAPAR